jgi:hypothetical protein
MGNIFSEGSVENIVNNEIKEEVDDDFLGFFNYITSTMNLKQLEALKAVPNYDWIINHWANKANSNRAIIDAIIDKKIAKEKGRSFGTHKPRKRRTSRRQRRSKRTSRKKRTSPN